MPPTKSIAVPIKAKATPKSRGRKAAARTAHELAQAAPVEVHRTGPSPVVPHVTHRFHIGERLRMTNGGRTFSRIASSCVVVARLPYEGHGHLYYRVRSDTEQYERVVAEMDLSRPQDDEP